MVRWDINNDRYNKKAFSVEWGYLGENTAEPGTRNGDGFHNLLGLSAQKKLPLYVCDSLIKNNT